MLVPRLQDEIRVVQGAVVGTVVFEASERSEVVQLQVVGDGQCVAEHPVNPDLANWAMRYFEGYLRKNAEVVREKLSLAEKDRLAKATSSAAS